MTTVIALFNNKGGVGNTTLTYHLASMVAGLGWRVLAVDLDPQANLTSAFFDEDTLEPFWEPDSQNTVLSAVSPLIHQRGDIELPQPQEAAERLWVVPGDLGLSGFEDRLSDAWPRSLLGDEGAIRVTTAFHRIIRGCAAEVRADVVFVDVGPNLGAINRAALLASDNLVVPLVADLFSLQGLRNLGPTLREWRRAWQDLGLPNFPASIDAPGGAMQPIGYVVLRRAVRLDRPGKAYDRWLRRIPTEFHRSVLGEAEPEVMRATDPFQLASLRNHRSLLSLAQDARKPMFDLRAGDVLSALPVGSYRFATGSSRISPSSDGSGQHPDARRNLTWETPARPSQAELTRDERTRIFSPPLPPEEDAARARRHQRAPAHARRRPQQHGLRPFARTANSRRSEPFRRPIQRETPLHLARAQGANLLLADPPCRAFLMAPPGWATSCLKDR